jgi:flagellar hook-length control protein FliK
MQRRVQRLLSQRIKQHRFVAIAQGKGQTGFSAQDNSGEKAFSEKAGELHPLHLATGKTDPLNPEKSPEPSIKMPSEPGRAWEQVLDILKKQEFKTQEVKELSIQLQPAELGKVNVSLRMENGQVHLVMNASEQATGVILQSHMQELKNGLMQMGVACGSFEMNYRQSGEGGSGQDSSRRSGSYHYQTDEEIPALTGNSSYFSFSGSGSRINVSA